MKRKVEIFDVEESEEMAVGGEHLMYVAEGGEHLVCVADDKENIREAKERGRNKNVIEILESSGEEGERSREKKVMRNRNNPNDMQSKGGCKCITIDIEED